MDRENEIHIHNAILLSFEQCNYDIHKTMDATSNDYAKPNKPDSEGQRQPEFPSYVESRHGLLTSQSSAVYTSSNHCWRLPPLVPPVAVIGELPHFCHPDRYKRNLSLFQFVFPTSTRNDPVHLPIELGPIGVTIMWFFFFLYV